MVIRGHIRSVSAYMQDNGMISSPFHSYTDILWSVFTVLAKEYILDLSFFPPFIRHIYIYQTATFSRIPISFSPFSPTQIRPSSIPTAPAF